MNEKRDWIVKTKDSLSSESIQNLQRVFQELSGEESVYAPLNLEDFKDLFLSDSENIKKLVFWEPTTMSFLAACESKSDNKNFLTFILVPQAHRRSGIATALLKAYQDYLLRNHPSDAEITIEISFFNPQQLTWIVPGTKSHDHPNAPGVELGSSADYFFENRGFRAFAYQNAYHVSLHHYEPSDDLLKLENKLAGRGIRFGIYDAATMTGFRDLFENLGSEVWLRDLLHEVSQAGLNRPVVVALKDQVVKGFTGPLDLQPSGRGYFQGIGVHSEERGQGIATVLFSKLCGGLKEIGARYMTLFTGETNPARKIYEDAGLSVVKSWSNLRKTIYRTHN